MTRQWLGLKNQGSWEKTVALAVNLYRRHPLSPTKPL